MPQTIPRPQHTKLYYSCDKNRIFPLANSTCQDSNFRAEHRIDEPRNLRVEPRWGSDRRYLRAASSLFFSVPTWFSLVQVGGRHSFRFKSGKRLALCVFYCVLGLFLLGCTANRETDARAENPFLESFLPCQLPAPLFGGTIAAQCGTLSVSENPDVTDGRQIDIHVAILPAVSRTPLEDPLFFIPGGPGQAASESYGQVAPAFLKINQDRDIVLVDQRGTGKSNPLRCDIPPEFEEGPEPTDAEVADWLSSCAASLDADPTQYTTVRTVADLDAVRSALGYHQINLYGVSYGSRVALHYAEAHPQHVRAMALDGVVPGDQIVGLHVAQNAQNSLNQILALCRSHTECKEAFPNVSASLQELLFQLDEAPIELRLPHPASGILTDVTLDRQSVASVIRLHSYAPETAALLPLLIHTAHVEKNPQPLAAQSILISQNLESSISMGLNLSVVCAEDAPYIDLDDAEAANADSYYQDFETERMLRFCQSWPSADAATDGKRAIESDVPTLLLSGEFDPVTPPQNAEQAAKTLSNSQHIVAPYQGHAVVTRGCIPLLLADFFEAADPQAVDASCVKTLQPTSFFTTFAGPQP